MNASNHYVENNRSLSRTDTVQTQSSILFHKRRRYVLLCLVYCVLFNDPLVSYQQLLALLPSCLWLIVLSLQLKSHSSCSHFFFLKRKTSMSVQNANSAKLETYILTQIPSTSAKLQKFYHWYNVYLRMCTNVFFGTAAIKFKVKFSSFVQAKALFLLPALPHTHTHTHYTILCPTQIN